MHEYVWPSGVNIGIIDNGVDSIVYKHHKRTLFSLTINVSPNFDNFHKRNIITVTWYQKL